MHFLDVAAEQVALRSVVHHLERQSESGKNGAQIVAHAVQHCRALLGRALDAPFHLDERIARLTHLARAAGLEFDVATLAEIFRRRGEPQDRADLVAQEQDRHRDQARWTPPPSTK